MQKIDHRDKGNPIQRFRLLWNHSHLRCCRFQCMQNFG